MIDISDGLAQDIERIAYSSYLGVDLRSRDIPIAPELATYCSAQGLDPLTMALTSGEDYELAFVVSSSEAETMLAAFHHEFRLETTVIGTVTDQWIGLRIDGNPTTVSGFDHFKNAPE
jgi:thiamine-monophosphate kinase